MVCHTTPTNASMDYWVFEGKMYESLQTRVSLGVVTPQYRVLQVKIENEIVMLVVMDNLKWWRYRPDVQWKLLELWSCFITPCLTHVSSLRNWGEMTGGITQNVPKLKFVEQRQLCWCLSPETFINQKWASWFWYWCILLCTKMTICFWFENLIAVLEKWKKKRNSIVLLSLLTKLKFSSCANNPLLRGNKH